MTADKALKYSLIAVTLLSVLFPVGAYFGVVVVFISAIIAGRSRLVLAELTSDKGTLAMLFCVLLSGLYSQDKLLSTGGLVLLGLNVGFYLVLVVELRKNGTERYFKILNTGCILACIYGVYQFASGDLIMQKSWVDEKTYGSLVRIYSTLLNPNIFAAYLAMNLSFGLARLKDIRKDLLLSINMVLSSICLLLTYSRGGFAAFFIAMLVLFLLKRRNKGIGIYLTAMIFAFIAINTTDLANRADLTAIYQDSSSIYRLEIWKAALKMFLEHPILGHGPGTTWYYLSGGSDQLYGYILHSHNIYLQVAAEMGIFGICTFICLLTSKINVGVRLLMEKTAEEEANILQGFIACAAGIAAHGLLDAVIFVPALSLIFMGYSAMYGSIIYELGILKTFDIKIQNQWKLGITRLLESKGVFKLLGSKGSCKDEY